MGLVAAEAVEGEGRRRRRERAMLRYSGQREWCSIIF